jgi:hypothetical protein
MTIEQMLNNLQVMASHSNQTSKPNLKSKRTKNQDAIKLS